MKKVSKVMKSVSIGFACTLAIAVLGMKGSEMIKASRKDTPKQIDE